MNYNPLLPEVKANLYAHYAYLREHAPVYWVESLQAWAVSRYADVVYVLKNPQLFSSSAFFDQLLGEFNPVPEIPWMITSDPPDHTRLRKLANKGFMPSMVRNLTPRVGAIALELVESIRGKRECDFMRDFSTAFPVLVIAEMLGIEPERRVDFKRWADDIVSASNRATATEEGRQRIRQSVNAAREYFEATIARRRQEPGDDIISAFMRAEEERQALTALEVLSLSILLLLGGTETTTNLLGSTMVTLLEQPDDLGKIRRDPSLIPQLIEESLRYHSPVQALFRQTTQTVEIAGTTIPANATVMPLLASANRDARKFPEPERFDLTRNTDGHVALGHGVHFCLGAPLARLEAKVALEALLQHLPSLRATAQPITWLDSFFVRGPKTLPLALTAA
ncbi:MAG: cytochrome P450 [Deltaproteobacteria bacterium]|nr:cytochrome P450 [Deltaproteobacteria bacterium]